VDAHDWGVCEAGGRQSAPRKQAKVVEPLKLAGLFCNSAAQVAIPLLTGDLCTLAEVRSQSSDAAAAPRAAHAAASAPGSAVHMRTRLRSTRSALPNQLLVQAVCNKSRTVAQAREANQFWSDDIMSYRKNQPAREFMEAGLLCKTKEFKVVNPFHAQGVPARHVLTLVKAKCALLSLGSAAVLDVLLALKRKVRFCAREFAAGSGRTTPSSVWRSSSWSCRLSWRQA